MTISSFLLPYKVTSLIHFDSKSCDINMIRFTPDIFLDTPITLKLHLS